MTANVPTIRRAAALACALLLCAGALAACGDSDDESSGTGGGATTSTGGADTTQGGGATKLDVKASEAGGLSFAPKTLRTKAGTVTFSLSNPSGNQLPHALEVEGGGVEEETDVIQPGDDATVTVDLKPGTYEFYCPVGNHRAQGMEGTLTVQ